MTSQRERSRRWVTARRPVKKLVDLTGHQLAQLRVDSVRESICEPRLAGEIPRVAAQSLANRVGINHEPDDMDELWRGDRDRQL
jgi:hypothetical protein